MREDYNELRYIETASIKSGTFSLFDDPEDRITLFDFLKRKDRILLLGNPGVGKSTELKIVFNKLWENLDETQEIPIFINIKNFRRTSSIEELLPDTNWQELPSIIFIIDGLDEIADIQDFVSELELFMDKHKHLKLKYILSCRTNIYEKYLINISGFESVYLKNLSERQINNILQNKYDLDIPYKEIQAFESILQTPFNLDLFANYYLKHGNFPNTVEESWELFITGEIEKAREKLIKRFNITKPQIVDLLKRVAVTNELMQQNAISDEDLFDLLGDSGIEIFQELPFIEKKSSSSDFVFRHKNFQEYFAARYISDLEITEIIAFIKAEDLEKVKPSLFNTTTFLLNLLKDEKFDGIKDWLFKNDIEILFFTDDNRLSPEFKEEIFETYFKDYCIDKTFWLANNGKVNIDILSKFANFNFLISEVKKEDRLERIRISALETLSYKQLSIDQLSEVKETFIELLNTNGVFFQSEILRAIKTMQLYKHDSGFWTSVLSMVKDITDRSVSHQIISILGNFNDDERDSKLLLSIIENHFSIERDNVIRGTAQIVGNIMLNTEDKDLFLGLFKMLFKDKYSIRLDSIYTIDFNSQLIEKTKSFCSNDKFLKDLVEFSFSDETRIMRYEFLERILNEIDLSKEIIIHILKTDLYKKSLYTICKFFSQESIDEIVKKYGNGELKFESEKDITSIRNWMSHDNLHLARYWEEKFIDLGHEFSELLYSDEKRQKAREAYDKFKVENFKLFLNRQELNSEIEEYFSSRGLTELPEKDFQKMRWGWYTETGFHGLLNVIHVVIERAFRNQNELTTQFVLESLKNDYFYLSVVRTTLSHNSAIDLKLEKDEISLLQSLVHRLSNKVDFSNVVKFDDIHSYNFTTTLNYEYIKVILYFEKQFNFNLSEDFYLNVLEYGNIIGYDDQNKDNFIDYVKNKISNVDELNQRVISNINNQRLIYIAQRDHIRYAIDNDLHECFDKIGEEIINDRIFFNHFGILENYLEKVADPLSFLKSCCEDITSHLCWEAVKWIEEKYNDDSFILELARKYLKTDETNFVHRAVNILFYLNQEDSLDHYNKAIDQIIAVQRGDSSGFIPSGLANYDRLNELDLYDTLFWKIYSETFKDSFYLHHCKELMRQLTANLSRTDQGYDILKNELSKIKDKTDLKESQAFYVNSLIEVSNNSYLRSKSQKSSFSDIVQIFNK